MNRIVSACLACSIVLAGLISGAAMVRRQVQSQSPPTAAVRSDDIRPDLFQDIVSAHEDDREVHDFLVAPPELIQRSLQQQRVLIYGQN